MRHRTFRGAAVLAVAILMGSAAIAFADTVPADGDAVTVGNQTTIALGKHTPGEIVQWNVALNLTCAGSSHPAAGAVIDVAFAGGNIPLDGDATATSTSIGPVPATWPSWGQSCPTPTPTLASDGPSVVTLTMPTTPGNGYAYDLVWSRSGASGLSGFTTMTFTADVVPNTPPTLSLPGPLTVEGNAAGGATVDYTASATDTEDNPDPVPACAPASGTLFPVGTTTVACSVTDGGGLTANGSFAITVVDTTGPNLVLPADQTAEATGPDGVPVAFSTSASDIVDGPISVGCDQASGDTFALGTTTVSCSAIDTAGNPTSGTFDVTVEDTTAPSLTGMPADMTLTTGNASGATLTYTAPGATDAADPAPSVGCVPASGSTIPVGTTTVTCTATDAAGRHGSASFTATVTFVSPISWSAIWGEPVASPGATFVAKSGRTIPIKVAILADGVAQSSGRAAVSVVGCSGGTPLSMALDWDGSRWTGHLDTGRLAGAGCYVVTAWLDGTAAGSFRLDLRGADAAAAAAVSKATKEPKAKSKP